MSPITQLQVCYIQAAGQHFSYTLLYRATFFLCILYDPPPKNCPSHQDPTPHCQKVIHWPIQPTTPNDIIGIHTKLLLLLVMYDELAQTYRISMWTSMHAQHTTRTILNFSKTSQNSPNRGKRVQLATFHRHGDINLQSWLQRCVIFSWNDCYIFANFS